jgi:HlyD family secretion protein
MITHASNDIEISKLEQQILDLQLQRNQEKNKLELAVNEAYDNTLAQISLWEQKYVMQSPVQGIVSFTRIWSENQNVRNGDIVMSVIPKDQGEVVGKINLPVAGSGKVNPGQAVNIKFANFPYMEYGMVRGTIRSISLVTHDKLYSAVVQLNEGLKTNYGILLEFNQDMNGIAEIITDDKRLLERVVYPVKAVITKQKGL